MTRLLFWIALVILVVAAIRSKLRAAMTRAQGPSTGPAPASAGADANANAKAWRRVEDQSETMLCCAHCGIYFPSSEAVRADGRDYCGTAHAREAHQQAR
jgi:uncharacterized protein